MRAVPGHSPHATLAADRLSPASILAIGCRYRLRATVAFMAYTREVKA